MKSLFVMIGMGMSALIIAACATDDPTTADSGDSGPETVAGIIAANPGATQVGPNEVQLDDGVIVIVPSAGAALHPDSASGACKGGNLCLFENRNFGGAILQLSGPCRTVDLRNRNLDRNHSWSNVVSSIDNPDPGTGPARFYNNGHLVIAVGKGHYLRDLSQDTSADGGSANDKIDTVQTCP